MDPTTPAKFVGDAVATDPSFCIANELSLGNTPNASIPAPTNWTVPPAKLRKFSGMVKSGFTPATSENPEVASNRCLPLVPTGLFVGNVKVALVELSCSRLLMSCPLTNCCPLA